MAQNSHRAALAWISHVTAAFDPQQTLVVVEFYLPLMAFLDPEQTLERSGLD
jgi:hypothetical protein